MKEEQLWEHLARLRFADLPEPTRESVAALVLDHLTCAVIGMDLPWTRTVRAAFTGLDAIPKDVGYLGPAHRYGDRAPLSTPTAALLNGVAVHGLDLDDLYLPAMTHPAAVIIPAAVAVAEATGAGGQALLAAVTAGYECMGRVGRAVGVRNIDHGFHGTGQQGPLGAAVAVGHLLGFDAARLENAAGLAASMAAGIKAFTAGPGMVKRLHAGRAAQAGVHAAHATVCGFEGPRNPLTSAFGFVKVFALDGPARPEELTRDLGGGYVVDDVYIKPYAACGALHGALVAAEQVAAQVDPADIAEVVVGSSRRATEQNSDPDPRDVMSAQYSMEYAVALALTGRVRDATAFLDLTAADRKLTARIRLRVDERAQAAYPDSNEGHVQVRRHDGSTAAAYGVADAAASRGWAVAEEKFRRTTAALLPGEAVTATVAAVRALAADAPVTGFLTPLCDLITRDGY